MTSGIASITIALARTGDDLFGQFANRFTETANQFQPVNRWWQLCCQNCKNVVNKLRFGLPKKLFATCCHSNTTLISDGRSIFLF